MMKSFRKSKRSSNSSNSSKQSISRVSSSQLNPEELSAVLHSPQKAIKALYDYHPQGPGELRFAKGDFFHVVQDQAGNNEANGWYEASNPATQQRGMVPMSYFEVFSRPNHSGGPGALTESHNIDQGNTVQTKLSHVPPQSSQTNHSLYATALFDFTAERPDELDVAAGENLVICAHHECEWFIAKPITRLGGPGLVPVSYVKIVDTLNVGSGGGNTAQDSHKLMGVRIPPSEDPKTVISFYGIPTVDQWKMQTARYEASSIPIGQVSGGNVSTTSSNSQYFPREGGQESNRSSLAAAHTHVIEAAVDAYHLDHGRYQYSVVARLSNGRTRYLHRYYQDFYDLQVRLLELFPAEAGKLENTRRIIPSIPGPLINVNDSISKLRREKLDHYLRNLVALPHHISRCDDVLNLFEVLENGLDREVSEPPSVARHSHHRQDRLSQYSGSQPHAQRNSVSPSTESAPPAVSVADKSAKVKVKFYYEDDIFVLLLPVTLRLQDLHTKLLKRLGLDAPENTATVYLFLKSDYDEFMDSHNIATDILTPEQRDLLFQLSVNDDERFQDLLYDKCKVVILSG